MSGMILARGRASQAALSGAAAGGAETISLPGADSLFSVGEHFFISEADGSETEWLGRVLSIGSNSISFSRALLRTKDAGALVWSAAAALETPAGIALPISRTVSPGVVSERTRGGDWMAISFAEPEEEFTLTLDGLTPASERAIVDWMGEEAGWGLWPFTLIEPGQPLLAVRLSSNDRNPVKRERREGGRAQLSLPLVVAGEGVYS